MTLTVPVGGGRAVTHTEDGMAKQYDHGGAMRGEMPLRYRRKGGDDAFRAEGIDLTPSDRERIEANAVALRERARRCLIYADMIAKEVGIRPALLAAWPYQPGEDEIDVAIAGGQAYQRKYSHGRPKAG